MAGASGSRSIWCSRIIFLTIVVVVPSVRHTRNRNHSYNLVHLPFLYHDRVGRPAPAWTERKKINHCVSVCVEEGNFA